MSIYVSALCYLYIREWSQGTNFGRMYPDRWRIRLRCGWMEISSRALRPLGPLDAPRRLFHSLINPSIADIFELITKSSTAHVDKSRHGLKITAIVLRGHFEILKHPLNHVVIPDKKDNVSFGAFSRKLAIAYVFSSSTCRMWHRKWADSSVQSVVNSVLVEMWLSLFQKAGPWPSLVRSRVCMICDMRK